MAGSIGPLLPSDEGFNHQIADTFATVSQTDYSWTEKVCGMAGARDGSLQVGFGFGKYTNRNVMDAYAGVSRGVEQWTVRASRSLAVDPETISIGPIRYEIVKPLHALRVRLEPNAVQPIAFDLLFEGSVPAFVEEREDQRDRHGFRRQADQVRYHQTGTAAGWVEVDGTRHAITPETWVCTRDHSWGVRWQSVGAPLGDLEPDVLAGSASALAIWNPLLFERADGSRYALHHYFVQFGVPGYTHAHFQGHFEHPDGSRQPLNSLRPEIRFDPANKRLLGGRFVFGTADGAVRPVEFSPLGDTGFHLGTGLYFGLDGRYHGSWRGELELSGEYFPNCADPATVVRINQFRDCMIGAVDPVGGGVGWGNCQTFVQGRWPELGVPGDE